MRALLCILALVTLSNVARAETITVTPSDDFREIERAEAGDVVEIAPGTYRFRLFLDNSGTAEEPIVYRAADPDDPPVWDLSGDLAENLPGSSTRGDRGRGCWQITGDHVHLENIVIQGCRTSSGNAAGVRSLNADGLQLRSLHLTGNQVGLSGNGTNTVVEHCEIDNNGRVSNPPQHNVYIYGGSIVMRHNHIHDSIGGQNLHLRSVEATVEANWIANAANYEVDMMTNQSDADAQTLRFAGNVVLTHESPGNRGQVFVLHNDSGRENLALNLELIGNTILVRGGTNAHLVNVRDDVVASPRVRLFNNVVIGTNRIFRTREGSADLGGDRNYVGLGADPGPLMNTVFGDINEADFEDAGALNFRPNSASALRGYARGHSLSREIGGPGNQAFNYRMRTSTDDLGAFEHTTDGPLIGPGDPPPPPPMDAGVPEPTDAGITADAGQSDAGAPVASQDASTAPPEDADDGGCNAASRSGSPLAMLLLLFAFRRRRGTHEL